MHNALLRQDKIGIIKTMKIQPHTIITSHCNPDFDALSSMVAAKKLYGDAVLINPSGNNQTVEKFFRLEKVYSQEGHQNLGFMQAKDVDFSELKRLVFVDTRQIDRVPHVAMLDHILRSSLVGRKENGPIIDVWDHHPKSENDIEADNAHVKAYGSTVALLVQVLQERSISLSPHEATIIGLGIYDDTGSFNFNSTTSHDFDAASWLLEQGMNLETVADMVRHDFSKEQISVLNTLLESSTSHDINGYHIVFTRISLDTYLQDFAALVGTMMDMANGDAEGDGNDIANIQETSAIFAMARMGDKVQVVARSRVADINVQAICQELGGGGHPFAASASVKNKTLDEVHDTIFRHLRLTMSHDIFISKLMSTPAITIEQHRTIQHAEEMMNRFGLKAIPVVQTNSKRCVGYLEYQTATRAISHELGHFPIAAYMQRRFKTITRHAGLQEVMDIIIEHRQRIVPVVHECYVESGEDNSCQHRQDEENAYGKANELEGNIIGVVTRTDLINAIIDASARTPEVLLPQKRKARNVRHLMQEKLPKHVREILEHAGRIGDRLGLDVYTVGGFVRDLLLDRPNHDIDIVVEGDGIAFAKIFAQELGGRVREHELFKTALIIYNDADEQEQRIDVATARLEYYEYPAALPSVALSSIKMDLFRRDFTINALALQLNGNHLGKLVDFFNAQRDIKQGIVRVLHSLSFVEDPTRMMRAVRFEKRYDFSLGQQTLRLSKNALDLKLMDKLSGARIFHEFSIISNENNAIECFTRMNELGMLQSIHAKLSITAQKNIILERMDDVLTWYDLLYLERMPNRWLTWLLCLSHGAKELECKEIAKRFTLTPSQTKRFLHIRTYVLQQSIFSHKHSQTDIKTMKPSALCKLFKPLELEGILYAMALCHSEMLRKKTSYYLNILQHIKADIDGHDLQNMGLEAGPQYAYILQEVLRAKLDGEAPSRALQLSIARHSIEENEKNRKTA